MIDFKNIHKTFGTNTILSGLNLSIVQGEIMCIIGTSGVGKSVTIKHLVGLLRPDQGEIWFDGQRIDHLKERAFVPIRKRIAMVFQKSALFDSLNALDNVALPIQKHEGLSLEQARKQALGFLEKVYMDNHKESYPHELSDGMQKSVSIARAMTINPEVMLFDEPTTGLDPVSARRIDNLICDLSKTTKMTSIVVSHDVKSIMTISDRIAFLYQGKVYLLGDPDMFSTSTDPIVQQFISGTATGPLVTPGF